MRVRVYDRKKDACFQSELYALLFDGPCDDETAYQGTKILAYSLRWRFSPEDQTENLKKE